MHVAQHRPVSIQLPLLSCQHELLVAAAPLRLQLAPGLGWAQDVSWAHSALDRMRRIHALPSALPGVLDCKPGARKRTSRRDSAAQCPCQLAHLNRALAAARAGPLQPMRRLRTPGCARGEPSAPSARCRFSGRSASGAFSWDAG